MGKRGAKNKEVEPTSNIQCYFLEDISSKAPPNATKPYASIFILDPIITVERHHGKYHIAARFNLETTIMNYENKKRDGHEYFFQDIRLQYLSPRANEELSMKPESDPTAALTVTRGTTTGVTGNAGLSLSQTPSANVSLGLNRSKTLTVEHALATWSLSAHRITYVTPFKKEAASKTSPQVSGGNFSDWAGEYPVYQWFWAGTHRETKMLSPDLKYTVKRHVVAKRAIPVSSFPSQKKDNTEVKTMKSDEEHPNNGDASAAQKGDGVAIEKNESTKVEGKGNEVFGTLDELLNFSFYVQVRVKKRFGRFHRVMILSSNEVKGKLLKPLHEHFRLIAKPDWAGVPEEDTPDVNALLNQIKKDCAGNYEALEDKDFFELSNAYIVRKKQTEVYTSEDRRWLESVQPERYKTMSG